MEDKKEYLSEEQFQKNKKKIINISLIVLIVGVLVGVALIVTGVVKAKKYESLIPETGITKEVDTKEEIDTIQKRIDDIQAQIDPIEKEATNLEREANQIFSEGDGFSDRYYEKEDEAEAKRKEIEPLKSQLLAEQSKLSLLQMTDSQSNIVDTATGGLFGNILNEVDKQKKNVESAPYYMFGAFIILFSAILAGGIYFFAIRREITAFTTQQVMPVAQEGLEKMAPSIGKVGEEIAKGVEKAKEEKK